MSGENRRHAVVPSNTNRSSQPAEWPISLQNCRWSPALAGQLFAGQFETVEIAQNCYGDIFRAEKVVSQVPNIIRCDLFDPFDQFVELIETPKIQFLAGQIRHPRSTRL